ncbi:MAG: hypothetical protein E5X60_23965 [Mesorhizobium sp.]|nr:MAG: hypothetical protein E5X60_23965 [Mesorhizobium sp.]
MRHWHQNAQAGKAENLAGAAHFIRSADVQVIEGFYIESRRVHDFDPNLPAAVRPGGLFAFLDGTQP